MSFPSDGSGVPAPAASADPGSTLCTACGACCEGVLHDLVALYPGEHDLLGRLSLPILHAATGQPGFPLPCAHNVNATCQVYADRPRACRVYRCDLLIHVEDGGGDLAAALAVVGQLRASLSRIYAVIGERQPGVTVWDAIDAFTRREQAELGALEFRRRYALLLLEAGRLSALCARHFDSAQRMGLSRPVPDAAPAPA